MAVGRASRRIASSAVASQTSAVQCPARCARADSGSGSLPRLGAVAAQAGTAFAKWPQTNPPAPVIRIREPLTNALSAGPPKLQHVPQGLLERDRRLPAGGLHEFRVVSQQD